MRRRARKRQREDHTTIAFVSASMLSLATVAVVEDVRYSATGIPLWDTWRFQPISIFAGATAFVGILYCLLRMNSRPNAAAFVEPYIPILVLSGANVVLKRNPAWLLPVLPVCIVWSVSRARKARAQKSMSRRAPGS
ncbi:MAG TPA: hypothetical protein VK976_08215 [Verrucomicrobiae bacterium]|jgi:hypothetical protein|nr:hypothetical protein [Verrucomicrobiae bacterium]